MTTENTRSELMGLVGDPKAMGQRVFTGVGSRSTPESIGHLMAAVARKLTDAGWTLRSGAADGADLAFESGVALPERKEIYLPYPGFNGSPSNLHKLMPACFELASQVHPAWERCSDFARKAHARNAFQVMGYNLMRPADMLICWTPDGAIDAASAKNAGGTRTAIVLANQQGIPVFNLQRPEAEAVFREWVGEDLLADVKPALRMKGQRKQSAKPQPPVAPPAASLRGIDSAPPRGGESQTPHGEPAPKAARFKFRTTGR